MTRSGFIALAMTLLLVGAASAEGKKKSKSSKPEAQHLSGMSIVGNDEAPKSLAIVPWKGSQLGDTLNAIKALDSGRQPVDRDVFARALSYYELRVGAAPSGNAAQSAPQP